MNDRSGQKNRPNRRISDLVGSRILPETADQSHGSSNLASKPRAGNISTDTRAGAAG
jgi:hypothetical protein